MNINFIISTVFEFSMGGFIIWGIFNEQKLVDFEDRFCRKVKEQIKKRKKSPRAKVIRFDDNTKHCA